MHSERFCQRKPFDGNYPMHLIIHLLQKAAKTSDTIKNIDYIPKNTQSIRLNIDAIIQT